MFGWFSGCDTQIIIKITRHYVSVLINGNKCLNWTCFILPCQLVALMTKNNFNNILWYSYFCCITYGIIT